MNFVKKQFGKILTLVVILALLVYGFMPPKVAVEIIHPKTAPLTVSIKEDGRTRIIDRYLIAAPVSGMTCKMHLNVGEKVKKDATLLDITPRHSAMLDARSRAQAQQNIAAAQASLKAAEQQKSALNATTRQAQLEVKRFQPLLSKGLISNDIYDKAVTQWQTQQANLKTASFQVDVAQHELEAAQAMLNDSDHPSTRIAPQHSVAVTSPIDGQILKVSRQCQGPVTVGESLLEVGDPSQLEVEVDVLSADAVKIKPGMKVHFDRWGGEGRLEGVVRLVEPVGFTKVSALGVEEQRVWIISDFTSPPERWQTLGDAYRVEAEFVLWHEEDVLQIPASALFRYQNGWAVFVSQNQVAKRRVVSIGKRNGLQIQVLDGLQPADSVIDNPNERIEEGTLLTH